MTPELRALCRADDLHIEGDQVVVSLRNGRGHRISVEDADDCYQLTGVVVRQAVVQSTPNIALHAWSRNRMLALAGFRIDRRGRLVGECWVPKVGLTA
ncbi:hypothetical protein HY251_18455 [bacterium]|nr:hypothetical protein [bacterium]